MNHMSESLSNGTVKKKIKQKSSNMFEEFSEFLAVKCSVSYRLISLVLIWTFATFSTRRLSDQFYTWQHVTCNSIGLFYTTSVLTPVLNSMHAWHVGVKIAEAITFTSCRSMSVSEGLLHIGSAGGTGIAETFCTANWGINYPSSHRDSQQEQHNTFEFLCVLHCVTLMLKGRIHRIWWLLFINTTFKIGLFSPNKWERKNEVRDHC